MPTTLVDRRPSVPHAATRRFSNRSPRKGPPPQMVVRSFLTEAESTILRAWIKNFDPEYKLHITTDQFCMGMENMGYCGDVYLLFQRLDVDGSGKLTLDEIDEETARLWLGFKQWCVSNFDSPLDMVYKLSRGKDYLSEDDFIQRCRLYDWKEGHEEILWSGVSLGGEEYVRPESLRWMAVGKEEHREKEEMKKLAMKVLAVKIRERQALAQVLPNFKAFLKRKCGGSILAAWRRHLDRHATMNVHKYELAKAVKALCWPGEFRILWKALDKDKSGLVSYQELDLSGAEILAEFKSFTADQFGSAVNAFHAMDKVRMGSGRLSEQDFIEECQKHGFQATRQLFRGLDFHATGSITQDEITFVDSWLCPSYLTAPKNETAAVEFKQRLKKIYHSYLKAWRSCLDKDNSNRVTWQRFQEGASRVCFHNDLAGAWRFLTAGSTYLTLHDIDPESAELISRFQSFADEQFGGMMSAFKLFDLDKNGYVDVTEFTRVLIGFGYPGSQVKALFNCLDVDGNCRLSRKNLNFIDDWARKGEERVDESQIMVVQASQKVAKKDKKIEISPRLLKLSEPRAVGPREAPTLEATRAMRMAALEDEILKGKGELVDVEEEHDIYELSGYYDYDAVKFKSQTLRQRTVKLLERLQETTAVPEEDDKVEAKAVKLPNLTLTKESRSERLQGAVPKKKRSPYDLR